MDSYITTGPGGTCFSGPDAVNLFRVIALRSAIKLLEKGIKPGRGWTMKLALAKASEFTSKTYTRSQCYNAIDDLTVWIEAMRSALPIEERK